VGDDTFEWQYCPFPMEVMVGTQDEETRLRDSNLPLLRCPGRCTSIDVFRLIEVIERGIPQGPTHIKDLLATQPKLLGHQ